VAERIQRASSSRKSRRIQSPAGSSRAWPLPGYTRQARWARPSARHEERLELGLAETRAELVAHVARGAVQVLGVRGVARTGRVDQGLDVRREPRRVDALRGRAPRHGEERWVVYQTAAPTRPTISALVRAARSARRARREGEPALGSEGTEGATP
jgi:hypothetical protein